MALSFSSYFCKRLGNWAYMEGVRCGCGGWWLSRYSHSLVACLGMVPKSIYHAFLVDTSSSLNNKFVIVNLDPWVWSIKLQILIPILQWRQTNISTLQKSLYIYTIQYFVAWNGIAFINKLLVTIGVWCRTWYTRSLPLSKSKPRYQPRSRKPR